MIDNTDKVEAKMIPVEEISPVSDTILIESKKRAFQRLAVKLYSGDWDLQGMPGYSRFSHH